MKSIPSLSDSSDPSALGDGLTTLGEYRLLREVGRGGMGVVYEAVQETLGRRVAVKVLPSGAARHVSFLERFRREARAAARLHHTNIVPVFGVGEHQGVHYYAMQFIEGLSLDNVLEELIRCRSAEASALTNVNPNAARQPPTDLSTQAQAAASIALALRSGHFATPTPEDTVAFQAEGNGSVRSDAAARDDVRATPAGAEDQLGTSSASGYSKDRPQQFFRRIARLVLQATEALAYAHRQGVLHRDIKPANLLLDTGGVLWVTDFGLAKDEGAEGLTEHGDIVGTLRYMAPERFQGKNDARGDIYGLGLTLYELATRRHAFAGASRAELIEQIQKREPTRPRELEPRMPRDLETIITRAIAKDPQSRYATAEALLEDLRRFLADRPILARRSGLLENAVRWRRRNPLAAALVAAVATALILGTAVSSYFAVVANERYGVAQKAEGRASAEAKKARSREITATRLKTVADRKTAEATAAARIARQQTDLLKTEQQRSNDRLYLAHMNLAQRAWTDSAIDQLKEMLDRQRPERTGGIDLRGFEWRYWRNLLEADRESFRIEGANDWNVRYLAYMPDGKRLVASSFRGGLIWDAATGGGLRRYEGETPGGVVCVSQSGELLATGPSGPLSDETGRLIEQPILLWSVEKNESSELTRQIGSVTVMRFSPDGGRLAVGIRDFSAEGMPLPSRVEIWSLATKERQVLPDREALHLAFSPDGGRLAICTTRFEVVILSADGAEQARLAERHHASRQPIWCAEFNPTGDRLATADGGGGVKIWNAYTGDLIANTRGHSGKAMSVAYSPEGDLVASAGDDRTLRIWDAENGRMLRVLRGHDDWPLCLAFRPDGQELASLAESGQVLLWNPLADQESKALEGLKQWAEWLAIAPDGRLAAIALADHSLVVWDFEASQARRTLLGQESQIRDIAFSSDGNRVAAVGADSLVCCWETADGRKVAEFRCQGDGANRIAFSPDGERLSCAIREDYEPAGFSTLFETWDLAAGKRVGEIAGAPMSRRTVLAMDPGGERVIVEQFNAAEGRHVAAWDTRRRKNLTSYRVENLDSARAAFSRDGKRFALWMRDHPAIYVHDTATGTLLASLRGHSGNVQHMAFSGNGKRLACALENEQIRLWDLATSESALVLETPGDSARCLAFSPSDTFLAAVLSGGEVRIWEARGRRAWVRQPHGSFAARVGL